MFHNGVITCLACSKETLATSLTCVPDDPYSKSNGGGRNRSTTGAVEDEYYYSDSDGDDTPTSNSGPGYVNDHIEGVTEMILNTQKANITRVRQLIENNLRKVHSSRTATQDRIFKIKESINALMDFNERLQEEYKGVTAENNQIISIENKLMAVNNQLNNLNPMDFATLKSLNDECLSIRAKLNQECGKTQKENLCSAVRQSTVKINFENTDPLLGDLNADNDTIFMKLCSTLENDPSLVYLTTYMLAKLFSDRIAAQNSRYKELLNNSFIEEELSPPPPLDDPTQYINFIKSVQSNSRDGDTSNMSPATVLSDRATPNTASTTNHSSRIGSDTSRSSSPPDNKDDKEWKVVGKDKKESKKAPVSFSEMAKKPGNPQPVIKRVPFLEKTIGQTNRPKTYFKVQIDNEPPFRVVFELRPDMAPKMVDNFIRLCKGLPDGRGYKGSKIFRAKANDHILGGDFENDDGTGGHSAYDQKYFTAEQCPLKDHKGAIRMKGLERTPDGRCKIGSQFMIWVGDLEYKEYKFTLVFGKVVQGFEQLQEVSRIKAVQKSPTSWVLRQTVSIVESGIC